MQELQLRPMTDDEFDAYRARLIPEHAAARVGAGEWGAHEAQGLATKAVNDLLPAGLETPGMLLLTAKTPDGNVLGYLWLAVNQSISPSRAYIYYIDIVPEQRGKGYGRTLLHAAELESAQYGAEVIALNVFATNAVARSLYSASGYEITSLTMRKKLSPESGTGVAQHEWQGSRRTGGA